MQSRPFLHGLGRLDGGVHLQSKTDIQFETLPLLSGREPGDRGSLLLKRVWDVGPALRYAMGELHVAYQEYRHFQGSEPGIREEMQGCCFLLGLTWQESNLLLGHLC